MNWPGHSSSSKQCYERDRKKCKNQAISNSPRSSYFTYFRRDLAARVPWHFDRADRKAHHEGFGRTFPERENLILRNKKASYKNEHEELPR